MAIPAVVYPLGVMLVNVPDLGWTLLAGASIAVAHASLALVDRFRPPGRRSYPHSSLDSAINRTAYALGRPPQDLRLPS